MKHIIFRRIRAFFLFAGWMLLLIVVIRAVPALAWDETHRVTYFIQRVLFIVLSLQSFLLVEIAVVKKVRFNVVRLLRKESVFDRILFGRRWRLDREFIVVTDGSKEIIVHRLKMQGFFGTGECVKVYRRQLDLKNRVVDRGIIFIRMTVIALAVGLVVLVS